MAKKRPLPPRVKRMKRPARLRSARSWLPTYAGKNIVRGYRKRFAVDIVCAIKELEMLGVKIDPVHKQQLLTTARCTEEANRKREAARLEQERLESEMFEYDIDFEFVGWYPSSEGDGSVYTVDSVQIFFEPDDDDLEIPF